MICTGCTNRRACNLKTKQLLFTTMAIKVIYKDTHNVAVLKIVYIHITWRCRPVFKKPFFL